MRHGPGNQSVKFPMTLEVGNLYRVDKYRWLLSRKHNGMSFLKTGDVIMIIAMGDNQITVINQEGASGLVYFTGNEPGDTDMEAVCCDG